MPSALLILNPNADVGNAWRRIADLRSFSGIPRRVELGVAPQALEMVV